MSVLPADLPSRPDAAYRGLPVFATGFPLFILLCRRLRRAGRAGLGGALPRLVATGQLPWMGTMAWHAHEMVFGFAAAVVVGFLFTAGKAWTGLQTPQGPGWSRWPARGWRRAS